MKASHTILGGGGGCVFLGLRSCIRDIQMEGKGENEIVKAGRGLNLPSVAEPSPNVPKSKAKTSQSIRESRARWSWNRET